MESIFIPQLDVGGQRCVPLAVSSQAFLCAYGLPDTSEVPRPGDQAKKGKRKGRNKQETPAYVEPSAPVEEVKTPIDLAKVGAAGT